MAELRKVRGYASLDRPYEAVKAAFHRLLLQEKLGAGIRIHAISHPERHAGVLPITRVTLGCDSTASGGAPHASSAEVYAAEASGAETRFEIEAHWSDERDGRAGANERVQALLESIVGRVRSEIDGHAARSCSAA
jgi:hypothetical protein